VAQGHRRQSGWRSTTTEEEDSDVVVLGGRSAGFTAANRATNLGAQRPLSDSRRRIAPMLHPYLTHAEVMKLAFQTFVKDVAPLSCCAS